jgi:hypothetical protein
MLCKIFKDQKLDRFGIQLNQIQTEPEEKSESNQQEGEQSNAQASN